MECPRFDIIMNNMVFLDVIWFGNTGLVTVQDLVTDEYKFYIQGENTPNYSVNMEEYHVKQIMSFGKHFPEDAGELLFKHLVFDGTAFKEVHPERFI